MTKPSQRQVGGSHYKDMEIQPWAVIRAHDLDYFTGTSIAYILRAGKKGDYIEDLEKAIHTLEEAIDVAREKRADGIAS